MTTGSTVRHYLFLLAEALRVVLGTHLGAIQIRGATLNWGAEGREGRQNKAAKVTRFEAWKIIVDQKASSKLGRIFPMRENVLALWRLQIT